jgi:hypothetical protein
MLLWIEPRLTGLDDDYEKGAKLRRQAARRRLLQSILSLIGCLCVVCCQIVYEFTYREDHVKKEQQQQQSKKSNIRKKKAWSKKKDISVIHKKEVVPSIKPLSMEELEKEESLDDFFDTGLHLPDDSIYRLVMEDIHGEVISLSQFAGMVTLVVNTACQ